jgi:hypothetical protein
VAVAQVSSPCQTTRAASAPVIRRRRPDGRHAQRRVADAAPLLDHCGFVGGDGGRRRHRQARAEPRRRSTGHHSWRPVRRRLRRLWNCVGACGQSVAHVGRSGDQRELQKYSQRRCRRRPAGDRFHRQGIARRSAGRTGRVLSHSLPGSFVSERARFAAGRAFSHRAERTAHHLVRLVGRYRRRRLSASTRGAGACAPIRPC